MDSIKHTTIQFVSGTENASSCNEGLYYKRQTSKNRKGKIGEDRITGR